MSATPSPPGTDLSHDRQGSNANGEPPPEGPTDSHVLSQVEQDEKGLSQQAGNAAEITDLGWSQPSKHFQQPIIGGLSNEDLWMLIRRFDKQVYNVKAVPDAPLQNLDLTQSADDEFSPEKLRTTLERFYTTVIIGLTSLIKHIARLRSWKEPRRTAIFCTVYAVAWLLNQLIPSLLMALLALVVFPSCRPVMFPPAPLALVDKNTGGVQKPKAGVLGSHDSMTGAPENFKGEAAEQEASNLVSGVATVAVGSAVGKNDQAVPEDAALEGAVPDATDIVDRSVDAQSVAQGGIPADSHDKTRQPMKQSVLDAANLSMQVINDITDTYEKFGNALAGTAPFPRLAPRLRLASVIVPLCLISAFVNSYIFMKASGFLIGVVFFGDPIIWRSIKFLDFHIPHWQKILLPQNSLLKGIPTNAQLTLTLLRIGEANASPLPPPPTSKSKPPSRPASLHHEELTVGASKEEITIAASPEPKPVPKKLEGSSPAIPRNTWSSRIIGFFRGTTATGVESKRGVDRMRAVVGSRHAANRLGVLRPKGKQSLPTGPVGFEARYKGKRGAVVIDSTKEPPVLYFTTDTEHSDAQLESQKSGSVLFTIPVTDIREMKKQGGLGWKGKLVVGWAMGGKEVVDGLLIVGKEPRQSYQLTAMVMRNQLFNRLIAIDGQVWERC
ncbi:uncharacterized protein N7484_006161 [Penicillium longicatenatum]|uniref:uncharacterized protein n=1 Tax=Penicillium longicatenatum TaxID=1561947 RepID=UPI002547C9F3|nr:uncharacterized protein N7484_006161 [Penicillium longicatenatum]KAJ5643654.1 hypothetical protein N7484_006161 [Penicillium longicatenatum]